MKSLLTLLLGLGFVSNAFSSVPIASSYVIQGWGTDCFLLMRPSVVNVEFSGMFSGIGTCYRIKDDGEFEKLWQIEGGYSFSSDVFLGGGGSVLIRVVDVLPSARDAPDGGVAKKTALEFYKDGKIFKIFKTEEIVDPGKLEMHSFPTLPTYQLFKSDYETRPKIGRLQDFKFDDDEKEEISKKIADETEIFCVRTVQAEMLVFKVSDGSLIHRKKLK